MNGQLNFIEKTEFDPWIKRMKERLAELEAQMKRLADEATQQSEIRLVIGRLEEFTAKVREGSSKSCAIP